MLLTNRKYNLFDEMFRDPFFSRSFSSPAAQIMKTDIVERDGNYVLDMELPGYAKENIQADLKDGYLTITAQKETSKEEQDENGRCIRKERYTGSSNRTFYVGEHVTEDMVKAAFKDGILHLEVPKDAPKAIEEPPKYIAIE